MIRKETVGSYWIIDEDLKRYARFPKTEGPRENPEWGTTEGPLKDAEWHDYIEWWETDMRLCIRYSEERKTQYISAPRMAGDILDSILQKIGGDE